MAKQRTKIALLTGFPPIAAADARVLVLGSMPSVASLAREQYYGHPQNAFWPIMGRLFGAGPELPYDERKAVLVERGVAVWDVLQSCRRAGSLDTAIDRDSEQANDFATFFRKHRQIGSRLLQRPESGVGLSPPCAGRTHGLLHRDFRFRASAVDESGPRRPVARREARRWQRSGRCERCSAH